MVKLIKAAFSLILMGLFIILPYLLFGQDSTGTGGDPGGIQLSPKIITILTIVLSIYEVVVRLIPTVKNYSILGFVIKLIQTLLPNRTTPEVKQEKAEALSAKAAGNNAVTTAPPALP